MIDRWQLIRDRDRAEVGEAGVVEAERVDEVAAENRDVGGRIHAELQVHGGGELGDDGIAIAQGSPVVSAGRRRKVRGERIAGDVEVGVGVNSYATDESGGLGLVATEVG